MLLNGLPDSCGGCPLSNNPRAGYFTRVTGRGASGVLIVGEASGEHEAEEGRGFIEWAPAGSILEKAIRIGGGTRDDYWITNVIRCRPPNNLLAGMDYEARALSHCRPNLDNATRERGPRAILALGATALRELTGNSGGKRSVSYLRGYPLIGPGGIPVVASYHPAFIARGNTRLLGLLVKDLATARTLSGGYRRPVVDPSTEMTALEGVAALEILYQEALRNPELWIAYDIETERSVEGEEDAIIEFEASEHAEDESGGSEDDRSHDVGDHDDLDQGGQVRDSSYKSGVRSLDSLDSLRAPILSIQFAVRRTEGVYGNWDDSRIRELAQRILSLPNRKIGWNNTYFDDPRLKHNDISIGGEVHDGMLMRRSVQPDLPSGLQQVAVDYGWLFPWKHYAGSNAILYGVADVCSVIMIVERLEGELRRLGIWEGYNKFIREIRVKVLDVWERRGIPVSRTRLDEYRFNLGEDVDELNHKLLERIPDHLHQKNPPEGYKMLPEEVREFIKEKHSTLFAPTPKTYKNGKTKLIKSKTKISDVCRKVILQELEGLDEVFNKWPDLRIGEFGSSVRLYEHVPFNPRSSQQMIAYLKYKGYEVPKTFKEGKETTGDKVMRRLQGQTGDEVIALAREIRAMEKMRDSYTGKIGEDGVARGGWIPDEDGRLRTRALTKSTLQFASVNPNVFTLPKRRGELARGFRRCIAAEPGHVLIEFDYKAFHDLTTAALAGDEIKWRTARIDPHSYVAAWLVKDPYARVALKMSDNDLEYYLKDIKKRYKKIRDEQAKPLNHGTNFGQGYRRLYFENEEYFESELQAKRMLEMLKGIYPKTFRWQEELLESLDIGGGRTPYLQSVWGTRRWFWDVWTWKRSRDGHWYRAKGQDAEKALAFLPANHAHGMFRTKMIEMADLGYLDRYELINFPHDAMVFHPLKELVDQCINDVKEWMEAPVIELAHPTLCPQGLSCAVDVQIGPDLGSLEEVNYE